jgi:hypothetical protein
LINSKNHIKQTLIHNTCVDEALIKSNIPSPTALTDLTNPAAFAVPLAATIIFILAIDK